MNSSPLVANFRDAGATINALSGKQLVREGALYRGGKHELISDRRQINSPQTVLNLRVAADQPLPDTTLLHHPAPNSIEVYHVTAGANRKWILNVLSSLLDQPDPFPLFVHCAAGKDRTGIIVAALFTILEIPAENIMAEYLMSEGLLSAQLFDIALQDLAKPDFFRRLDLSPLLDALLPR